MHILIITQDDPIYLVPNIKYLLENLPKGVELAGCIIAEVSPFGKKESFLKN